MSTVIAMNSMLQREDYKCPLLFQISIATDRLASTGLHVDFIYLKNCVTFKYSAFVYMPYVYLCVNSCGAHVLRTTWGVLVLCFHLLIPPRDRRVISSFIPPVGNTFWTRIIRLEGKYLNLLYYLVYLKWWEKNLSTSPEYIQKYK